MTDLEDLRRASTAVYLATEQGPASDLSAKLLWAVGKIERLRARYDGAMVEQERLDAEIERMQAALVEAEKYNGFHQGACIEIGRLRARLREISLMTDSDTGAALIAEAALEQKP